MICLTSVVRVLSFLLFGVSTWANEASHYRVHAAVDWGSFGFYFFLTIEGGWGSTFVPSLLYMRSLISQTFNKILPILQCETRLDGLIQEKVFFKKLFLFKFVDKYCLK